MKAYVVGNKEEPEIGNEVIYAKNTKEARRVAHSTDIAEEMARKVDEELTNWKTSGEKKLERDLKRSKEV